MDKKKIIYFSDCNFFAGCESMIPNFLNSEEIRENYNVDFIYRKSPEYENELFSRLQNKSQNFIPVKLPKQHIHKVLLKKMSRESVIYKVLASFIVLIWKYLSITLAIYPLWKVLRKEKPDILHINNGGFPAANTSYSAIFAAKLSGVKKIIYVVNNIAQDYKSPIRWLDLLIDPYISRNVTLFITGSKNASIVLAEVLKLPERKVINIANGIKPREVTLDKYEYLRSLNIDLKDRLLFSTIALLEERKGHIWLLKAIKLMKESNGDLLDKIPLFIIEGEGGEKGKLEDYIHENKLNDDVKLIGNESDIFNLINASDVIVVPSIANEDFPNVVIEAMSMGKPVIGTEIAGIPEQIDNNVNGYVVAPKDTEEMILAIKNLMDMNQIQRFSDKAKQKYNANYTVSVSLKKYMSVYK